MDLGRVGRDLGAVFHRVESGAVKGALSGAKKGFILGGPLVALGFAVVFGLGGAKDGLGSVAYDVTHDLQASLPPDAELLAPPAPAVSPCSSIREPDASSLPPAEPPTGTVRFFAGGNCHDDDQGVLPWAFATAREREASAFIFLGDMEHAQLRPETDDHFVQREAALGPVPLYPVVGNHEVRRLALVHPGSLGFIDKLPGFDTEAAYRKRFLDTKRTPVEAVAKDATYYSTDLPGSVHFVSLDNVSQKGFGKKQLEWLAQDLAAAQGRAKHILVGAHMPLAENGVTTHGMDEEGAAAVADSRAALALFEANHVEVILHAHLHEFAAYTQGGIRVYISGGLGAYLPRPDIALELSPRADPCVHQMLELDVTDAGISVNEVVFPGG